MDAQARIEKVLEQYKQGLLATDEAREEIVSLLEAQAHLSEDQS
jgi:hypothetical protein